MKRPSLTLHSRRMCAAVGLVWLLAFALYMLHFQQIAFWVGMLGTVLGVTLLVMMSIAYVQERRKEYGQYRTVDTDDDEKNV